MSQITPLEQLQIGLTECDVLDDKGSLVARAKSTCLLLEGEDAAGR